MQQNISLVYDLLFLIVFAVVAVCSWHKGFLASLAELIGAVFGVGIAVWASQTAAPQIYEKFLSASVANRVELALRESNGNIAEALQGISFLPESMQQSLLNLLNDAGSDVPAKIAEALQPLILPFVQVLLFVVLCVLVRWVFRLLVGALRWFNGVPLLGSVNRLLGLVGILPQIADSGKVHVSSPGLMIPCGAICKQKRYHTVSFFAAIRQI